MLTHPGCETTTKSHSLLLAEWLDAYFDPQHRNHEVTAASVGNLPRQLASFKPLIASNGVCFYQSRLKRSRPVSAVFLLCKLFASNVQVRSTRSGGSYNSKWGIGCGMEACDASEN